MNYLLFLLVVGATANINDRYEHIDTICVQNDLGTLGEITCVDAMVENYSYHADLCKVTRKRENGFMSCVDMESMMSGGPIALDVDIINKYITDTQFGVEMFNRTVDTKYVLNFDESQFVMIMADGDDFDKAENIDQVGFHAYQFSMGMTLKINPNVIYQGPFKMGASFGDTILFIGNNVNEDTYFIRERLTIGVCILMNITYVIFIRFILILLFCLI